MADEGAAPAVKKSGDSKIKPLLLIAAGIMVVQVVVLYFLVAQPLMQQRDTAQESKAEGGSRVKKGGKAAKLDAGGPAEESGDIEIKDLVININPQGGGTKSYLSVSISLDYALSKAEKEEYAKEEAARAGKGGGGDGGGKVFEKAVRTKLVDKVIEFFSSKPESELIAGGAGRRALRRELRHTLNWMINHPNAEEPPPIAAAPSAAAGAGQNAEGDKSEGGGPADDEGAAHPIKDIYFTNFVMQ